jgi:hypothetical protein
MTVHFTSSAGKQTRAGRRRLEATISSVLAVIVLLPALHGRATDMQPQRDFAWSSIQAQAVPGPDNPKDQLTEKQKLVLKSLEKGVEHLRSTQTAQGTWSTGKQQHPVGYAAMPGLALLESGVPAQDAAVQKAAEFIRGASPKLEETYEIALAILFLNRLGDAKDVPLIRTLAYRLIAGQCPAGGWSYRCPILGPADEDLLLTFLKKNEPKFANTNALVVHPNLRALPKGMEALVDPVIRKERETALTAPIIKPDPEEKMTLPGIIPSDPRYDPKKSDPLPSTDPAKKPAAPTNSQPGPPPLQEGPVDAPKKEPAKKDPAKKDTPKPGSGSAGQKKEAQPVPVQPTAVPIQLWPTVPPYVKQMMIGAKANGWAMGQQIEDNSNTQFAILGLWAARKHGVPLALTLVRLDLRFRNSQLPDGAWAYHLPGFVGPDPKKTAKHQMGTPSMTCVGLIGLGVGHGVFQDAAVAAKKNPAPANYLFDPAIQKGLSALSRGVDPRINFEGARVNLYFFWSLERTMVMFHLPTLGGVDWHTWGTDVLLPRQTPRGSWSEGGYPGSSEPIDTSMAMLFLSRANLNRDLSESLRRYVVVLDPAMTKAP